MSRTFSRQSKKDEWWVMACCSLLLHLSVYVLLLTFHFSSHVKEAPVYYVDVVNLPVARPQAGSPGNAGRSAAPPPPPAAPPKQEMVQPSPPPAKARKAPATPVAPPKPTVTEDTSREFDERMKRLEQEAEARHEADALKALKERRNMKGAAGMPGAAGNEAGSDYASYIQARLKDALQVTIAYQTKKPEVTMRITISRSGRISRMHMEHTSGDKIFEDAVSRAIARAERSFPPPPTHEVFETGFVFKPQEIVKR